MNFHRNYRCFCFFSVSVLKPSIFSTKSPFAAFFHVVNRSSWKSLKLQQRKLTPSKHMAWVCSLVAMRQILSDQNEKSYSFIVCLFDLGFRHYYNLVLKMLGFKTDTEINRNTTNFCAKSLFCFLSRGEPL